jgi:diketogulonate reductase-like aldo/keto reductase
VGVKYGKSGYQVRSKYARYGDYYYLTQDRAVSQYSLLYTLYSILYTLYSILTTTTTTTTAQLPEVALRWITQSGASFTVASQSAAHFAEDLHLFDWQEP